MRKYEILSNAIELAYCGEHKKAWEMVYEADEIAEKEDSVYWNLRDSVCTNITAIRKMSRNGGAK